MRLTCPSCASQYEIDAAAIGARGRMVRCANCGAEWFQSPSAEPDPAPVAAPAPAPEPVAPPPEPPRPEPVISAPAPAPAPEPRVATRDDIATYTPPGAEPRREDIVFDPEPELESDRQFEEAEAAAETRVRRRPDDDRDALAQSLEELREDQPVNSGGAFLSGFSTIAVLAVILIGVYIKAPDIVKVAPAVEEPLQSYTNFVDRGRLALAALTQ